MNIMNPSLRLKKNLTDKQWLILGLESSCDDTAASVLKISNKTKESKIKILSSVVFNQNNLHSESKIDEVNDFDDILRIHLGKEKTKD